MGFDGIFLNKIKNEIKFLETGRISKILEIGNNDYIFVIRRDRKNYNLLLSFSSTSSRIHLTNRLYDNIINPKSFTIFLRKHIEGYFIENIDTYESDRILIFKLKGYTDMQDLNTKYLYCEVMGRYSNLILTDDNNKILDSLKHDGVGEYNRTILPNAYYEFIKSDKLNPFLINKDDINSINQIGSPKDLMNKYNGVSMLLAYNAFKNDDIGNNFYNSLYLDIKPSIIKNENGKEDYYYNPLSYEIIKEYDTLSSLLDDYYYENDIKANVKSKTNDLANFVNKQLTKFENKLAKLNLDLDSTDSCNIYKMYGELLLSYPNLKEKLEKVTVYNYYDNKEIDIPLDHKYTIIDNSNRYFKKYQKIKGSIKYINEQIEIVKNEIEYFKLLKHQLEQAQINEALEIQDELINNKYLFNRELTNKNKKQKPKILTYEINDVLISVGKNNIQNEYVTHKLSKPNDMWFHVKQAPGSHVVIHTSGELGEDEIRACANLAAYYSEYRNSSSVPVDYTRIKYIKKIPGKRQCFVTYTHESTIYVDPNYELIEKLRVRK